MLKISILSRFSTDRGLDYFLSPAFWFFHNGGFSDNIQLQFFQVGILNAIMFRAPIWPTDQDGERGIREKDKYGLGMVLIIGKPFRI